MRFQKLAGAVIGAALSMGVADAQEIEWQQTIDLPRDFNLPSGVVLDILGVAIGDRYDVAKGTLMALAPEGTMSPTGGPPFQELNTTMYADFGTGTRIEISYPSRMLLERRTQATGNVTDKVQVDLSAPSSGSQVILVERSISYQNEQDQPRVSEIIAGLTAKIGLEPVELPPVGSVRYFRWQFADGAQVLSDRLSDCEGWVKADLDERQIEPVNRSGECDALLMLQAHTGISEDHAERLRFYVSDNERGKQNLSADYAFFDQYIEDMQSKAGAAPAL